MSVYMNKVLLLFIISTITALSQTPDGDVKYADKPFDLRPSYGFFAGIGYNLHNANFAALPGCISCNTMPMGSGKKLGLPDFGVYFSFPLDKKIELSLRFYYFMLGGDFSLIEPETLSDKDGNSINGEFEYILNTDLTSVGINPVIGYRVTDQLTLNAGIRAGYILSGSFDYKEQINSPSYGVFKDINRRVRNAQDGDIDSLNKVDLAISFGASYDLPLNSAHTLFLVPEASFHIGILPIADNWSLNTFFGGIGIKYAPREIIPPKVPPMPPPYPALPPPPQPGELLVSVSAVSVDDAGKEEKVTKIHIEEFISRKVHPLLNYVFFDDNSSEIQDKYKLNKNMTEEERNTFSVNSLYGLKTIDVYYNILNIVGRRMIAYPIANLTVNGYNNNIGPEKGNTDLSKRRAEAVKDYLVREWGISPDRIRTTSGNLPPLPSNINDPDGIAENRRVEISSDFEKIFESLNVSDTIRKTNPPKLRFKPYVSTDIGVKSWKITTAQASSGVLKVFEGTGALPKHIEWNLKEERDYAPKFSEDFIYSLEVVDNDNNLTKSKDQAIKVQAVTTQNKLMELLEGTIKNDVEFDQYTLISFGFNKAELTNEHKPIVETAKGYLKTQNPMEKRTFNVDIIGRTDRIGDELLNKTLSLNRALNTADGIEIERRFARGIGEENPLFDNNTPEGRFYNRNVTINVETTIELINE